MGIPIPVVDGILNLGGAIIERLWPDPVKAEEAKIKLAEMAENGELQRLGMENGLLQGQLKINELEAQSQSLFVAGWRPFIGWVCGVSIACYYIPYVLVATVIWAVQCWQTSTLVPRPDLGIMDLIGLCMTLLGMATLRTKERLSGKVPSQL